MKNVLKIILKEVITLKITSSNNDLAKIIKTGIFISNLAKLNPTTLATVATVSATALLLNYLKKDERISKLIKKLETHLEKEISSEPSLTIKG